MKLYSKKDFEDCNTLEEVMQKRFDDIGGVLSQDNRKSHYLKYMPKNGRYREIGSHQGFGMASAIIAGATYLDGYDVVDRFQTLKPFIDEYVERTGITFNNTITKGSHNIGEKPEVDIIWIDAKKTGDFVYKSLVFHKDNITTCMAVDDLVSSKDICKGVDKFLKDFGNEWKIDYEDRINYPGIAVLIKVKK